MLAGRLESMKSCGDRDVKIITLTWNGSNELGHRLCFRLRGGADGLRKGSGAPHGICRHPADVSHLNERGFWDVAQTAKGPFIASHSVSASIYPHARNLKDEQFAAIRRRAA